MSAAKRNIGPAAERSEADTVAHASRPLSAAKRTVGYSAEGVDHTLSMLIFSRVLNAARNSSVMPMLTA